ncbi:chloride channel protein [Acrasis kona]|uniref:Chloride channel protein n=1 Tax=Acrasis kona TaxID=1008807 RepID=A0AAW2ZNM4_9EUKA
MSRNPVDHDLIASQQGFSQADDEIIQTQRRAWYNILISIRGTVIKDVLLRVACLTLFSTIITALYEFQYITVTYSADAHKLIGLGLSLLLVYRTNSSYDRYWEGRKLWADIVNGCRNMIRFGKAADETKKIRQLSHLLCAYCFSLKQRLRGDNTFSRYSDYLNDSQMQFLETTKNKPFAITLLITDWTRMNYTDRESLKIMEQYTAALVTAQGGLERIMNTQIPFSYIAQIHHILFGYLITLPFVLTEYHWAGIAVIALISFAMLGIEESGIEIEDPFGEDKNDLPLDAICSSVLNNVRLVCEDHHVDFDEPVRSNNVEIELN